MVVCMNDLFSTGIWMRLLLAKYITFVGTWEGNCTSDSLPEAIDVWILEQGLSNRSDEIGQHQVGTGPGIGVAASQTLVCTLTNLRPYDTF